jgi:hypothetical protein
MDSRLETYNHIQQVIFFINELVVELIDRGVRHDYSKLYEPEKSILDEVLPKLKDLTYGSDEYKEQLSGLKEMSKHHYADNRHHPEHFENGIEDMDLVDLCEMLCDWLAATQRNKDGDIYKSIEINQQRYDYPDILKNILKNTIDRYFVPPKIYWNKKD